MKYTRYAVENLLRPIVEYRNALAFLVAAVVVWHWPAVFFIQGALKGWVVSGLTTLALWETIKGLNTRRYQKRLLQSSYFAMSTHEVPHNAQFLYLGHGFQWTARHTQRLHMLSDQRFEQFTKPHWIVNQVRLFEKCYPNSWISKLTQQPVCWNPVKPLPAVGGKPWIHGLGGSEKPIFIPQKLRTGHMLVFGTTGVGKTRFASILINQDIRNGEAVLVLDPKGDLELMQDMYSACKVSGRIKAFQAVHVGFPDVSAHYNPLSAFDSVSEVATRITSGIAGQDGVFKDFAWKFANIVANCLYEMGVTLNYRNIGFYMTRLDVLLKSYVDTVFCKKTPDFKTNFNLFKREKEIVLKKDKKDLPPSEADWLKLYLKEYIDTEITNGNLQKLQTERIVELLDAAMLDKEYYDKITASVTPVFAKINQSNAAEVFSFDGHPDNEIKLMDVIKKRKVIYIGLDSMNNEMVARAVGKAIIADLVSAAGKIYKENAEKTTLCIHSDEFSEIVENQFIILLNKGRGAGMKVTAYSQTINDIESAFSGNTAKAKMAEGNFNTLMMLRVENADTANALANKLPQIDVFMHSQDSGASDKANGRDGIYFTSNNSDGIQAKTISMVTINDVISLPTGQAFVFTNGGELYKIRAPLPKNDGLAPDNISALLSEINGYTQVPAEQ